MGRLPRHAEFFRVWTPAMAYVLGYWWADGCMRIKSNTGAHEFEIASNDRDHLETIARTIGGNYSLRKVSEGSQCYKISFCSKEMYQDILAHGGTPRKSRTIGFPFVPPDLLAHFVRGVVDAQRAEYRGVNLEQHDRRHGGGDEQLQQREAAGRAKFVLAARLHSVVVLAVAAVASNSVLALTL